MEFATLSAFSRISTFVNMQRKRIIFIAPYPKGMAASQRFRFEQYLDVLEDADYEVEEYGFWSEKAWKRMYHKGQMLPKFFGMMGGFLRRKLLLLKIRKRDIVFIHREATPILMPFVEWWVCKVIKCRTFYDFDDAIWLPNTSDSNKRLHKLKSYGKVKKICSWVSCVVVGNEFLAEYAQKFNDNVKIIPTTVDLVNEHNLTAKHANLDKEVVIGWTGSHSTLRYLDIILPVLDKLAVRYPIKLIVISDVKPDNHREYVDYIKWNKELEINTLTNFNIGVMPLFDDDWSRGKCGFKAIQYLSAGVPALVSPVGVNKDIIQDGVNGFLCAAEVDWEKRLVELIDHPESIRNMSAHCRQVVEEKYSKKANSAKFIHLFS